MLYTYSVAKKTFFYIVFFCKKKKTNFFSVIHTFLREGYLCCQMRDSGMSFKVG